MFFVAFIVYFLYCFLFFRYFSTKNNIKIPIILNIVPSIFRPPVASFWSPNPNIFFVMILASYISVTPANAITTAINFITASNIFSNILSVIL